MKLSKHQDKVLRYISQDKNLTPTQVRFLVNWFTDSRTFVRTLKAMERELGISEGNINNRVVKPLIEKSRVIERVGYRLKNICGKFSKIPVFKLTNEYLEKVSIFSNQIYSSRIVFDEEGALHSEEDSFHSDPRLTKREKIKEEFASFDNDGYSLPSLKGYFNSKKSRGGQNEKK